MNKLISWNNRRRNWVYWVSIELLLFIGLNISWWLDSSNSVVKLINIAIMMSFNLHTIQLFICSIFPIHLGILAIIALVNHIAGVIPDIKRVKLFRIFRFGLKSAFWSDILVGVLLEEVALMGLAKLSETFKPTSITMLLFFIIFLIGSLLYWKQVFPVIQHLKIMWRLLNGKDYEKSMWFNVTNSNFSFSTFNRVLNKGKISEVIVDRFDLEYINSVEDNSVDETLFLYYLVSINQDEEISEEFVQKIKSIVNLPHAKILVCLWGEISCQNGSEGLIDALSKCKNVWVRDYSGNKHGREIDIEKILSSTEIRKKRNTSVPFRIINNKELVETYYDIGTGPKICLDFMKTILNDLETLPAIYALFDYIDLQYRIVMACTIDTDYVWMRNNWRNVGNLLSMGGYIEEKIQHHNCTCGKIGISTEEIFQEVITADEFALIEKYLPNYEIDKERPVYNTINYLTRILRNVLRGHGMFDISDARMLFELVFKLALLNTYILGTNSISLDVERDKVWADKEFCSVFGTNEVGEVKNMSPFLVATPSGNVLVFNNWIKVSTKDKTVQIDTNTKQKSSTCDVVDDVEAIEYINYLDGSLIMPEFLKVDIDSVNLNSTNETTPLS